MTMRSVLLFFALAFALAPVSVSAAKFEYSGWLPYWREASSTADALALAVLHDFNARRGDEVIVPALSFVATGNAVLQAGFIPVFVDIDRKTLNIDPSKIEKAITKKTRAIMR